MEVSGRRLPHLTSSDSQQLCDQCKVVFENVQAHFFCVDCDHFLCEKCKILHNSSKVSNDHTILKGHEMPRNNLIWGGTNTCLKDKEKYRYYCTFHDEFCCPSCIIVDHGKCETKAIKDLLIDFEKRREYDHFMEKLKSLMEELRGINKNVKITTNERAELLVSDMNKFGVDLGRRLIDIEKKLQLDIELLKQEKSEDTFDLEEGGELLLQALTNIYDYLTDIDNYKQKELLFIAVKQSQSVFQEYQRRIKQLSKRAKSSNLNGSYLCGNNELAGAITVIPDFGKIITESEDLIKTEVSLERQISVKHKFDTAKCWITGIEDLGDDFLVVTDNNNVCVKLVDLDKIELSSYLKLPKQPWDVSSINYNHFVVSTDDQLLVINVNRRLTLSLVRQIGVNTSGTCSGVRFSNGNFIISILDHKPYVMIMNGSGAILKNIPMPDSDLRFTTPLYVETNHALGESSKIYVSDSDRDTIYCIGGDNKVKTFSHANLKQPYGLATDRNGGIFVAGSNTSNVHHISGNFDAEEICLDEKDELPAPQAIAFCHKSRKLVVSSNPFRAHSSANFLFVYG